MACDATARLYDVDEDSVVFKRLRQTTKYDQATVTFRAREGRLIDLDKLHESIWATRLSGGTRSGLVSLDVAAIGRVVHSGDNLVLKVADSEAEFVLEASRDDKHAAAFSEAEATAGSDNLVRVTGLIDNYSGRWPSVLQKQPTNPRRILVTGVKAAQE